MTSARPQRGQPPYQRWYLAFLTAKSRYVFPRPFFIPLSCSCRGRSAAVKRNFSHQQPMENAL